jgi:hypothetical protein
VEEHAAQRTKEVEKAAREVEGGGREAEMSLSGGAEAVGR